MPLYEYKVVPAPNRGVKARGVKGSEEKFALALETIMNEMGEDGWEFRRSETLPQEERKGLTQSVTEWRNMLVFRRTRADDLSAFQPRLLERPAPQPIAQAAENTAKVHTPGPAEFMSVSSSDPAPNGDDGVSLVEDVVSINPALRARAAKIGTSKNDIAAE